MIISFLYIHCDLLKTNNYLKMYIFVARCEINICFPVAGQEIMSSWRWRYSFVQYNPYIINKIAIYDHMTMHYETIFN